MALAVPPEPIHIDSARKPFRREGLGFAWDCPQYNATISVDYISPRDNALHGEVTVTLGTRAIYMSLLNMSDGWRRKLYANALEELTPGQEIPWRQLIDDFCISILKHERRGSAIQYTKKTDRVPVIYGIDYLAIRNTTNSLFAPGGSAKGQMACAMCVAVKEHRGIGDLSVMAMTPLYLDWEDDFEEFQQRINLIANGMEVEPPEIAYVKMRGYVPDRIQEIARYIQDARADFVVIDSFSAAAGTVAQGASWDTIAHRFFDALEMIKAPNITWMIIDHVSGENVKDPKGKAFGSIQKMNRVRNSWEMRTDQEPGSSVAHLKLFDAKWNRTGKRKPLGLRMDFSKDAVVISGEDPAYVSSTVDLTVADKMARELSNGDRLSTGVLALSLGVQPESIRTALRREKERFIRDHEGFISLRQDDAEEDSRDLPF